MSGPLYYDRVMETTATTGTGTLTLLGAVAGYQSFGAVGNGNTCYYCVYDVDSNGNPNGNWEVGQGTYTSSGTTLSRTTILASSNSGAAVSFGVGTKRVILVEPADRVTHTPFTDLANTFTVGPQTVQTGADANVGVLVKGNSTGQTGSLVKLQGGPGGSNGRAELALLSNANARPLTLAVASDILRLLLGGNGTDYIGVDVQAQPGGLGAIFNALVSGGGFGFQVNGAGTLAFGSSSTAAAYTVYFGARPNDNAACSGGSFQFYGASFASQVIDAVTNAVTPVWYFMHHSSGTPAAGFGESLRFQLDSSTTNNRDAFELDVSWITATDASRAGQGVFYAWDTAAREVCRMGTSGSAAQICFFGAALVAQQNGTCNTAYTDNGAVAVHTAGTFTGGVGSTGYTIGDVVKALKNYGLLAS
jgi:hypothetical protein